MTEEEWRIIPSEPLYHASSLGRIYSTISKKVLSGAANKRGYIHVVFSGSRSREIHRAITEAFLGPCPDGRVVRHMDGNPGNNAIGNLAYGTPSENSYDKGRHGTDHQLNKTRCPKGHAYDEVNTLQTRRGRSCRSCDQERRTARAASAGAGNMVHGASKYKSENCRCDICKADLKIYLKEQRKRRAEAVCTSGLPSHVEHGLNAYAAWGCRCETCRAAKAIEHARQKARRAVAQ